jgi:hypothetical protein
VISRTRPSFWQLYRALPTNIEIQARDAYVRFMADPSHTALHFKKLAGYEDVWSVRIGAQYRVVGHRRGETIDRFWIGTHNDFDKAF